LQTNYWKRLMVLVLVLFSVYFVYRLSSSFRITHNDNYPTTEGVQGSNTSDLLGSRSQMLDTLIPSVSKPDPTVPITFWAEIDSAYTDSSCVYAITPELPGRPPYDSSYSENSSIHLGDKDSFADNSDSLVSTEVLNNYKNPQEDDLFSESTATTSEGIPVSRLVVPRKPLVFNKPTTVRGIYLNPWAAGSRLRSQNLIDLAKRTEVNTFVIDIKDATGYISHPTKVMFAREIGADQGVRIKDLVGLLERLHEAGIYPIARIVIVKDSLLTSARPDLAVQDIAGGVWVDDKGMAWANLFNSTVWQYHISLAKEAAAVGFPEIQWDYLRFPDAPKEQLNRAWYPGQGERIRTMAVQDFLRYAHEELLGLDLVMTADVFGFTTSAHNDIGIGQLWEDFIGLIDVALPMVYPSHYWPGVFDIDDPNGHPYEVVREALIDGMMRSVDIKGAGMIRPWLQDFTMGPPPYGPPEVRAQIQATYDAGISEWILWNPSSRFSEAALAPANGYPDGLEPTIRAGGRVVPCSKRFTAMEEERAARALVDSLAQVTTKKTIEVGH